MAFRPTRTTAVVAALVAVLTFGAVGAASAADSEADGSDVAVSVPVVTLPPSTWEPPRATPAPVPNPGGGDSDGDGAGDDSGGSGGDRPAGAPAPAGGGQRGGAANGSNTPVAPAAPTGAATEPTMSNAPSPNAERATADKEHYVTGDNVSVSFGGLTAGEQVQVVLFSEPRLIGSTPAGADGSFAHTFALPDDLPAGTHTVQLTGWQSKRVGTVEIFVTADDAAAASDGAQGVPLWAWWAAGGLGAVLLAAGAVWVLRSMRAGPEGAATAEATA